MWSSWYTTGSGTCVTSRHTRLSRQGHTPVPPKVSLRHQAHYQQHDTTNSSIVQLTHTTPASTPATRGSHLCQMAATPTQGHVETARAERGRSSDLAEAKTAKSEGHTYDVSTGSGNWPTAGVVGNAVATEQHAPEDLTSGNAGTRTPRPRTITCSHVIRSHANKAPVNRPHAAVEQSLSRFQFTRDRRSVPHTGDLPPQPAHQPPQHTYAVISTAYYRAIGYRTWWPTGVYGTVRCRRNDQHSVAIGWQHASSA